jgi:hypothetical protein
MMVKRYDSSRASMLFHRDGKLGARFEALYIGAIGSTQVPRGPGVSDRDEYVLVCPRDYFTSPRAVYTSMLIADYSVVSYSELVRSYHFWSSVVYHL